MTFKSSRLRHPALSMRLLFFILILSANVLSHERGPYLQNVFPHAVTLVWETASPERGDIEYWRVGGGKQLYSEPASTRNLRHVVTLSGLEEGTLYCYRIVSGGTPFGEGRFRTAPTQAADFSFLVFGDSGAGSLPQHILARTMERYEPDLILHTGDLIYPGGEQSHYNSRFFHIYHRLLRRGFFYPSIGNHDAKTDSAQPYLDNFELPALPGEERFYSFTYGEALFVALDPVTSPFDTVSAQYRWLENLLAHTDRQWKFVFFHYPLYSSGKHGENTTLQAIFAPLFERYEVDVVFNGHDHHYERTIPIKRHYPEKRGVVYIITGGGGGSLGAIRSCPAWSAVAQVCNHFVWGTLSANRLTLEAIDANRRVFDQVSLRH